MSHDDIIDERYGKRGNAEELWEARGRGFRSGSKAALEKKGHAEREHYENQTNHTNCPKDLAMIAPRFDRSIHKWLTLALTGARPLASDKQTERRPGVQCRAQVRCHGFPSDRTS